MIRLTFCIKVCAGAFQRLISGLLRHCHDLGSSRVSARWRSVQPALRRQRPGQSHSASGQHHPTAMCASSEQPDHRQMSAPTMQPAALRHAVGCGAQDVQLRWPARVLELLDRDRGSVLSGSSSPVREAIWPKARRHLLAARPGGRSQRTSRRLDPRRQRQPEGFRSTISASREPRGSTAAAARSRRRRETRHLPLFYPEPFSRGGTGHRLTGIVCYGAMKMRQFSLFLATR